MAVLYYGKDLLFGGSDVDLTKVEELIKTYSGDKTDLLTDDKTTLVNAINEIKKELGLPSNITIPDWKSGTSYKVNDLVIYNNNIYKCINAHTSSAFNEINWNNLSLDYRIGQLNNLKTQDKTSIVSAINELINNNSVIKEWVPGETDNKDEYIIYDGNLYLTLITNAENTFNETNYKFEVGSQESIKIFKSETEYLAFANNLSDDDDTICFVIGEDLQEETNEIYATEQDILDLF